MSSIERRAFLRYKKKLTVRFTLADGSAIEMTTRDISLGGMQVNCDSVLMNKVLPQGITTAPGDQVILPTEFKFSVSQETVSLRSHVLGVLRRAESEYSIRCAFVNVNQMQLDQLQRLLNQ